LLHRVKYDPFLHRVKYGTPFQPPLTTELQLR
jgi:hypothetical protein